MEKDEFRELTSEINRMANALERIADHLAPAEASRKPKPAVLSAATYSREERDRQEVRAVLRGEKPQPQDGTAAPAEG